MSANNARRKTSAKRKILIALCVVLSIILVAAIAFCLLVAPILFSIGEIDNSTTGDAVYTDWLDPTDTKPIIDAADAIPTGKNVINVLLVGQDRRSGEGRMHSDAMILCTINKTTNTLTMTSFMRDVWVYIPEHYNERMNVPYMVGGFPLLNDTLSYNFGVQADYNVEIDFAGFMAAVDLVGGLDIELSKAEADYLNRRGNWDLEANEGWQLVEGVNHLNGSQALAYSRIRAIDNDFERTGRQRIVLTALVDKAKTLNAAELYELVRQVVPMISTDMSKPQIMGLAMECIPMLSDLKIVSQRVPMDGTYYLTTRNGASVIAISDDGLVANKQLLIDTMKEK